MSELGRGWNSPIIKSVGEVVEEIRDKVDGTNTYASRVSSRVGGRTLSSSENLNPGGPFCPFPMPPSSIADNDRIIVGSIPEKKNSRFSSNVPGRSATTPGYIMAWDLQKTLTTEEIVDFDSTTYPDWPPTVGAGESTQLLLCLRARNDGTSVLAHDYQFFTQTKLDSIKNWVQKDETVTPPKSYALFPLGWVTVQNATEDAKWRVTGILWPCYSSVLWQQQPVDLVTAEIVSHTSGTLYKGTLYQAEGTAETVFESDAVVNILNSDDTNPVPAGTRLWVIKRIVANSAEWQGRLLPINGVKDTDLLLWSGNTHEWCPSRISQLSTQILEDDQDYPWLTYGPIPEGTESAHKNVFSTELINHLLKRVSGYSTTETKVLTIYNGEPLFKTMSELFSDALEFGSIDPSIDNVTLAQNAAGEIGWEARATFVCPSNSEDDDTSSSGGSSRTGPSSSDSRSSDSRSSDSRSSDSRSSDSRSSRSSLSPNPPP